DLPRRGCTGRTVCNTFGVGTGDSVRVPGCAGATLRCGMQLLRSKEQYGRRLHPTVSCPPRTSGSRRDIACPSCSSVAAQLAWLIGCRCSSHPYVGKTDGNVGLALETAGQDGRADVALIEGAEVEAVPDGLEGRQRVVRGVMDEGLFCV